MEFSLYGVLEWAQLSGKKLEVAHNANNILLFLYVASFMVNRKAVFITAFLLVELYGVLFIFDALSDSGYYFGYALCYVFCYWVVFQQTKSIKICLGYVILVLFELNMSHNEWIRPQIETIAYTYYEYIVMVIHIYIISTITKWRKINVFSRSLIAGIRSKLSHGYSVSFFCYTIQQSYFKNKKLCR